ncbi:hypothetical protein GLOTRDRAFT_108884, partial [Gloeophyllum trabeum ATCC 11539]
MRKRAWRKRQRWDAVGRDRQSRPGKSGSWGWSGRSKDNDSLILLGRGRGQSRCNLQGRRNG